MSRILQVLACSLLVTLAWGWHHSTYVNEPGGRVDGRIDLSLLMPPDAPTANYFHEKQAEKHSVEAQAAHAVVGTAKAFLALSRTEGKGRCWGDFVGDQGIGNCENMNFTGVKAVFTAAYSFFVLRKDGTGVCFGAVGWLHMNCTGLDFTGVTHVYATRTAFMVLKLAKGKATTGFCWGLMHGLYGNDQDTLADCSKLDFTGVTTVYTNGHTFVGLRVAEDKSTTASFCYGASSKGGNCADLKLDFAGVTAIYATGEAFLALKVAKDKLTTGFCWGSQQGGGNCMRAAQGDDQGKSMDFQNTAAVFATYQAFLALKHDGSGICWGFENQATPCDSLDFTRVAAVHASDYAFVALEQPGPGFCWGDQYGGGRCKNVNKSGITHMYLTYRSFLFLKQAENQAGCWGDSGYGCANPNRVYDFSNVTTVYSTGSGFLVLKDVGPAECIGHANANADAKVDDCALYNSWIKESNIADVDAPACHVKHSNMKPGLSCRCDPGYANSLITLPSNRPDGKCTACKAGNFSAGSKIQAIIGCAECPSGKYANKPRSTSCKQMSFKSAYIACVAFCVFEVVLILGLVCVAYNETKLGPGEPLQYSELVEAEHPLLDQIESEHVQAAERDAASPARDRSAEELEDDTASNSLEANNVVAAVTVAATFHAASWCRCWPTFWRPCASLGLPAPCDITARQKLYWNEVILVAAEAYTMMSVTGLVFLDGMRKSSESESSIKTKMLMFLEKTFRVALFDFASYYSFYIEFALAWLFPLVVAVSYFVGWRKTPWSLNGVYDFGQFKPIQVLFDACSLPVVKTLISASICQYNKPEREPSLAADEHIVCQSRQQLLLASAGWLGTSIFFLWLVATILRKSTKSDARLYDFFAISVLVNTKAVLGIATAFLRHTHPVTLLAMTCLINGSLLSMCWAHPGPCRFIQINHYRRVSLCFCFVASQLVLTYEMEMGAQVLRSVFVQFEVLVFAAAYTCTKYWLAWERARRKTSETTVVPRVETQETQIEMSWSRSASALALVTATQTPT